MPTVSATENIINKNSDLHTFLKKNGLESEIEQFTNDSVNKLKFSLIIKPAIISFVALIISFFIDVSNVPILGNVSDQLAKSFFPSWQPTANTVQPFNFWWLPIVVYVLYIFLAYLAFNKLKAEVIRTPASETIDRIITSYTSVTDSISTALPLIGAAILLLSIRMGQDIFLGLSVPFEIKALIILALGKLFEPILDQMGIEFQNIVNHVSDIKERYFSRIQTENSKQILNRLNGHGAPNIESNITENSLMMLKQYNGMLEKTSQLSEVLAKNFTSLYSIMEKVKSVDSISSEKIDQLNAVSHSIVQAANSLSDEKTINGLKHLESIVLKK